MSHYRVLPTIAITKRNHFTGIGWVLIIKTILPLTMELESRNFGVMVLAVPDSDKYAASVCPLIQLWSVDGKYRQKGS
jgi:hypothetical protein